MNPELFKLEVTQTLRHGMPAAAQRMARRALGRLEHAFWNWPDLDKDLPEWAEPVETAHRLSEFMSGYISAQSATLEGLRARYAEYSRRLAETVTLHERQQQILNFARELGANRRAVAADRRAFARWFDHSAVVDRYNYQHAEIERQLSLALERLGVVSWLILEKLGPREGEEVTWDRLALERSVKPLLVHNGDPRVRVAAFQCLATALRALPAGRQEGYVTESTLQYIYRSALNPRAHVWIQREALVLLQDLSPASLATALQNRLRQPRDGDDMFVRHEAVGVLARNLSAIPSLIDLLDVVYRDDCAFVRQGLADALPEMPREHVCAVFAALGEHDASPQVRAAALNRLPELISAEQTFDELLDMFCARLRDEQDPFVIRVALHVIEQGHHKLLSAKLHTRATRWCAAVTPELDKLRTAHTSLKVRRWAALTTERLWSNADVKRRELKWQLQERLREVKPGRKQAIAVDHLSEFDTPTLGRVLSVLAQDGYDWGVGNGRNRLVLRNHRHRFRLWRWLYELRHPSTDKRQAHRHTTGRVFYGNLLAPSARMAELSETKVPGEPLYIAPEDGWRPYLPLVDQLFSCMDEPGGRVTLYTAEGTTRICAPREPRQWLRARTALVRNFARFADLRNWQEDSQANPNTFINETRRLGFDIQFQGHPPEPEFPREPDPSVTRFFALTPPLGGVSWEQFKEYFFSIYENSLQELGVFAAGLAAVFIGRHIYLNRALRKAREHIPLVVGGWGTRGKSGTERLKSALFNALGYSIVSKTTGCEAMFLHGMPFGQLREMFLFRPYDKATIWEQANVLRLAQQLDAEVFLWECMGLQPVYVEILQRQWMRDDLATITNTYPDHEDLQGPAGINVAETIARFIPPRSTVLASEEQMLPVLNAVARESNTECKAVGWLEAGMLTNDVMERFPYEEHPYNVALVIAMAEELGIDPVYAVKEIADRVVPDLGVLKTYPKARVQDRFLEFIMGNSANERLGCLTNWTRMGMDKQDIYEEPGTWVTTVVNNRADRVARSRVFANILVEDISVDRHFLIGTNLKGLRGYIEEAWQDWIATVTLWPETQPNEPLAVLEQAARRMRVPLNEEHVRVRLAAMLDGVGAAYDSSLLDHVADSGALKSALEELEMRCDAGQIVAHTERHLDEMRRYTEFVKRIENASSSGNSALDDEFRKLLWEWFAVKLVIIEDSHATGEQIVQRICEETPPGIYNRIMGMQNIKGTGLDFVYRWEAWLTCHTACQQLSSNDPVASREGLRALAGFQEFGLLSEWHVREVLENIRGQPVAQSELFQAELPLIEKNLEAALETARSATASNINQSGWVSKATDAVEAFLDAGDAIRRRKTANRIYKDLVAQRISHQRAALELQKLNKRQKGGWLNKRINELIDPWRQTSPADADAEKAS